MFQVISLTPFPVSEKKEKMLSMWPKLCQREESWVNISLPLTTSSRSLWVAIMIVWTTWSCSREFGCNVGIPIEAFLFWLRKWGFQCVASTSSLWLRTFFYQKLEAWALHSHMPPPVDGLQFTHRVLSKVMGVRWPWPLRPRWWCEMLFLHF